MLLLALSCATGPQGLLPTPNTNGPIIRVDYDAEPIPDIPYPNNMATVADPTSVTGRRLNVATESHTHTETEVREKMNRLTGFGTYAPITVGFEGRLDVQNILDRHADDPRVGRERLDDDVLYLINVDPGSESFLEVMDLDLGEGRFPMDAARPDKYFPNDTRAEEPSLIFDTIDEDLNGNGVLDPGEDTDNDGTLDVPNVWPPGGDTREDLLTWYELTTDSLILRPVEPLDEETTYAMVLTSRLVDEEGEVVTSPWEWVNHTSQTDDLQPLHQAMPSLGLELEDVAFAWTFTTGSQTADLVNIQKGLNGEGPFQALQNGFPTGFTNSIAMHELDTEDNPDWLPIINVMETLTDLGLFDADQMAPVLDNYNNFASALVGAHFVSPDFLVDEDGDGDHDEYFRVDPFTGEMDVEAEQLAMTCVLPKDTSGVVDVGIYGHGYGSTRIEFLTFAHAFNRMGMAVCAIDFPNHGPGIKADELALYEGIFNSKGLTPLLDHLVDARYSDLDNDGSPDSGGDQWSADAFHTRDMVRQAAVDWMWMVRSIHECGEDNWEDSDGGETVTCDWDGDGEPDMGGPDANIYIAGGSLGGINVGVAAPVIPEVTAWAAIVPGFGLLDTAFRTEIGGAVEAMVGRLFSPLMLGIPQEDGSVQIQQWSNTVTDMAALPVATLSDWPQGGTVVLENLRSGVQATAMIPSDGTFRVAIAADAPTGPEKALLLDIPETGAGSFNAYSSPDNEGLGDPLSLTFYDADGDEVMVIDTWEAEVVHEGVTYEADSPLVASNQGFGHVRTAPSARRVAMSFASILEPGDPIAYAPYYQTGHPDLGGEPINILIMPTAGDTLVPISTGYAGARAAGLLPRDKIDARYGTTVDDWLVEVRAIQGLEQWGPYTDVNGDPALFDVDDLDNGTDGTGAPSEAPLRAEVSHENGVIGLRVPYVETTGTHGFNLPEEDQAFDVATFAIMQAATYFASGGTEIHDDVCLADASCDFIPQPEAN